MLAEVRAGQQSTGSCSNLSSRIGYPSTRGRYQMIDFHKRIFNSIALPFGIFSSLLTPTALAHGISDEQKQRMLEGGYGHYVGLGAEHMLTGYDHLLFLFGVLFFLTNFRDIAKFVTVFTIGHHCAQRHVQGFRQQ